MRPGPEDVQARRMTSALGQLELCNVAASGKAHSEDLVQAADSAAWLFDGASAHDDTDTWTDHDASWFVCQLSQALTAQLGRLADRDLTEILAAAIGHVSSLHTQLCPHLPSAHTPSATAVIVRRSTQNLEYLVLGDSTLLVQTNDGEVHHHADKRLSAIAPDIRDSIHQQLHHAATTSRRTAISSEPCTLQNEPHATATADTGSPATTHMPRSQPHRPLQPRRP